MIHITLGRERQVDPETDGLQRDRVGYSETMSELALYDANHGCWVLGPRALKERYALVTFGGIVRQAIGIDRIEKVVHRASSDTRDDRSVIHGEILRAGHPVYDEFVGKLSPVQGVRNPVTYFDSTYDKGGPCLCGCGKNVAGKDFLPGHDQTALHDRVKQIGTVADFLKWFDVVRGTPLAS